MHDILDLFKQWLGRLLVRRPRLVPGTDELLTTLSGRENLELNDEDVQEKAAEAQATQSHV